MPKGSASADATCLLSSWTAFQFDCIHSKPLLGAFTEVSFPTRVFAPLPLNSEGLNSTEKIFLDSLCIVYYIASFGIVQNQLYVNIFRAFMP